MKGDKTKDVPHIRKNEDRFFLIPPAHNMIGAPGASNLVCVDIIYDYLFWFLLLNCLRSDVPPFGQGEKLKLLKSFNFPRIEIPRYLVNPIQREAFKMALLKIRPLKYFQPSSLTELLVLLEKFGGEGKIIAGGTDLVVQLKTREVPPLKYIFDIENMSELDYIRGEGEILRVGPIVKHRTLKASPVIREKAFILAEAVHSLATPQIRNMGTIGGNLCNASPAADTAPPSWFLELR